MSDKALPADIVFSPADISELTETYLAQRRHAADVGGLDAGLPIYIDRLDAHGDNDDGFLPVLDGDLVTIIARPGNGKTSFMMRWARERAKHIRTLSATGDADAARRVVVYITLEQTVEALHSFHVAAENKNLGLTVTKMARGKISDVQWEGILAANVRRVSDPLWFMGHSISRPGRRPIITMDSLPAALWEIVNWQGTDNKFRIDSIFFDYLQRAPYNAHESKTVGISDNLDFLKNLAFSTKSKIIAGVQATREVDKRDDPTPGMDDGQWTSNIEQASDAVITLVRPAKYKNENETFAGKTVQGFCQMRVTVAKQKMGDSNFDMWVEFDPRYNELEPQAYKKIDLSKINDELDQ